MGISKGAKIWIGVVIVVVGLILLMIFSQNAAGELDEFAQCLEEKEATFFGAFWCPHCQDQKSLFGRSERLLPYVECSTPDGRGQLPVCDNENISSYPTWEFADGERQVGVISLAALAEKTGCQLP